MTELCRLCGQDRPLLLSHIIPAFVFKWKRDSAGGSHLRSTVEPNLRVQDGIKKHWLCEECEQLFSKDERNFANRIFYPYLENSAAQHAYGPWLLRFCASVSWRLLRLAIEDHGLKDWDPVAVKHCHDAELAWREFLLGKRANPGEFRQHILPFDIIEKGRQDSAPNINRYLTRAIQIDLCQGSTSIFTFAKLGRFGIFGSIRRDSQTWRGTQVQANEGVVGPRRYELPSSLWDYLNDRAREAGASLASVSDKQHEKIEEAFRQKIDRFVDSDAFRAMNADVEAFGDRAFSHRESDR